MEAYYKERQKQIKLYVKNIKKLAKNGSADELSRVKKEYVQFMLKPPTIKRDVCKTETLYSEDLNHRIRKTGEELITLKYDLCYDLYDGLHCNDEKSIKEFDSYEKKLALLKRERDKFEFNRRERETIEEGTKKKQQEKMNRLTEGFTTKDKDGMKTIYQDILALSAEMANPRRQVVAYEIEHKELEYRLIQLYDPPLFTVKISG